GLPRVIVRRAHLLVRRVRVGESAEVSVDSHERSGEPFRTNREVAENRRAGALDAVEGAARGRAEGDGDQDERGQHEDPDHSSAPEGGASARGERLRPWSGNRWVQDRAATAVSRHGTV